jgi:hypothetical protein
MTCDSSQTKLIDDSEAKQAFYKFVGQKTLMYLVAAEGCDKKRLMDCTSNLILLVTFTNSSSRACFGLGIETYH